jgi:hypothetical protein
MPIFGPAFDLSKDRWIAFSDETAVCLSEHKTQADALNASRRYLECEVRRTNDMHSIETYGV